MQENSLDGANIEHHFKNIKYERDWNCELISTLTDSLNLSRFSVFILNSSLIEILICISWKVQTRYIVLLKQRAGILLLFYYSWWIANTILSLLICFDRSVAAKVYCISLKNYFIFFLLNIYVIFTIFKLKKFNMRKFIFLLLSIFYMQVVNSKWLITKWLYVHISFVYIC